MQKETERSQQPSLDALDIIKKCVVECPPSFEDLPESISINHPLGFCPEALVRVSDIDTRKMHLLDISNVLRNLHNQHGIEFSCSVIADHEGNLKLAPIIGGEETSVEIHAPLQRREINTSSGLTVYRDETISAAVHTHGSDFSFSLQDIYAQFMMNNGSLQQIYVVRRSGVIDMAHRTVDTSLLDEESFLRLSALWNIYLDRSGMFREGISKDEYNAFIQRILNETLKIGFYTNEGSGNPAVLLKKLFI